MTNPIALVLGLIVLAVFAADAAFNGAMLLTFLGQQLIRVTEWVAFWR